MPEAEVFSKLGEPSGQTSEEADESLGMGPTKELQYSGLVVGLHKRPGSDDFSVWRFVVTGKDWEIAPGFEIGTRRTHVRELLGPPDSLSEEDDTVTFHYGIEAFDGWYWARFRGGLLTEFGATEDWS